MICVARQGWFVKQPLPTLVVVSEQTWDGVTRRATLSDWAATARDRLADAARAYDWGRTLELLDEHPEFVNSWRPDGATWFAPLHQVAHAGASNATVRQLVRRGAWRALRTAAGERPVDIARRRGHSHLIDTLEPPRRVDVPNDVLLAIQARFHAVVLGRSEQLVREHGLRLPELDILLELDRPELWFPVPGMYGGFSIRLEAAGMDSRLVSDSWCRVVGGSEERHVMTATRTRQQPSDLVGQTWLTIVEGDEE